MKSIWLFLFSALLSVLAGANAFAAASADLLELSNVLTQRFPTIAIEQIKASPVPGLFEVYTNNEIVYTDARGDWVLMGQLLDAKTRQNVTAASWNDYHRVDYQALPFDQAIRIVKGDGNRQMAIFEDPHCPFCQELESSLQAVDDVTIHVFLYPLEDLHPGASVLSRKIWCSTDRAQAWLGWMNSRAEPVASDCAGAPIDSLRELGVRLRINSTPTLLFPDGERVPGAINIEGIEKRLAAQGRKE